jgi:putative phosphotransacetylase
MNNIPVKIEVSARHIHLSRDDYNFLFGSDKKFKIIKNLSQKGEFASDKKVQIIGPDGALEARFLGPFRDRTQLELSMTDCFEIGISAPCEVEVSDNSAEVKIIGESGEIIKKCAIVAKRHLHCNQSEAKKYQLNSDQELVVAIKTSRGEVKFWNIIVRIADHYRLRVHLDTDEGNAAGIDKEIEGILIFEK